MEQIIKAMQRMNEEKERQEDEEDYYYHMNVLIGKIQEMKVGRINMKRVHEMIIKSVYMEMVRRMGRYGDVTFKYVKINKELVDQMQIEELIKGLEWN